MNESSVSSPFLTTLRQLCADAVVFKHADVGMKGLPDASMTWKGSTLWMEFKLHQPARHKAWIGPQQALEYFQGESPVQAGVCKKLARASRCIYIIWRKKVKEVWLCDPEGLILLSFSSSTELANYLVQSWPGREPIK